MGDSLSLPGTVRKTRHVTERLCQRPLIQKPEDGHRDLRKPLLATEILDSVKLGRREISAITFLFLNYMTDSCWIQDDFVKVSWNVECSYTRKKLSLTISSDKSSFLVQMGLGCSDPVVKGQSGLPALNLRSSCCSVNWGKSPSLS